MNSGSRDAADASSSTYSVDRLATRQVQNLVASGQLRRETAVLPRSTSRSFILPVSPSDHREFPIRAPDEPSFVHLVEEGLPHRHLHDPFHHQAPARGSFRSLLESVGRSLPVSFLYENLWWPRHAVDYSGEWISIRYILLPQSWWWDSIPQGWSEDFDPVPRDWTERFATFLRDLWYPDDRWSTYQRDFGSIENCTVVERVFDDTSRFTAVCQLHFAVLDYIGRRYDCVGDEPNALWQSQVFTNKHPSTARITSRDQEWGFIHYERPSFVSQALLCRPEWRLLVHEPPVSEGSGRVREGPTARAGQD